MGKGGVFIEKLTVWFNHWFSTAYHIIELMKQGSEYDLHIIGSNRNPDTVIQLVCDEWYTEPIDMSDEAYLEFCVEFCQKHNVNVFVPRRGISIISQYQSRFAEIGVKLFMDKDPNIILTLKNKVKTYEELKKAVPECMPMYFEVGSKDEFIKAYDAIIAEKERVCMKFTDDEGAASFRVIDDSIQGENAFYIAPGMKMTYENALKVISDYSFKKHLILMPYLKGVEVSADCLTTETGKIIIPRFKSNGRIYTIKYDEKIIEYCSRILDYTGLNMPCNIQFRYDDDEPYLLEINTRMSGGVQLSCIGTGINIPLIALNKLMGKNMTWKDERRERKVSYIESPLIIL